MFNTSFVGYNSLVFKAITAFFSIRDHKTYKLEPVTDIVIKLEVIKCKL